MLGDAQVQIDILCVATLTTSLKFTFIAHIQFLTKIMQTFRCLYIEHT